VLKRGRKGRISNELVAASAAAILAVYAAGTWRTRDEARRFGVQDEMRRPARPVRAVAAPAPATNAATTTAAVPVVTTAPMAKPATVPAVALEPKPASKPSVKIESKVATAPAPAPSSVQAAAPAPQSSKPVSPVAAPAVADGKPGPAPEPTVATDAADAAESAQARRWLDGYYTGWGQSRHGDIQAFVRIESGRIVDAGVASCETRYPCDVIDHIIPQPVERQSADVDRVSRATESADAYYNGLVMALEHAESGTYRSPHP
jgi:uncharacterized protein with FMN-binding domain